MYLYIVKQIKLTENVFVGKLREVMLVLVAVQQTFIVNIDKNLFQCNTPTNLQPSPPPNYTLGEVKIKNSS